MAAFRIQLQLAASGRQHEYNMMPESGHTDFTSCVVVEVVSLPVSMLFWHASPEMIAVLQEVWQ